jgi:hypothetical protein
VKPHFTEIDNPVIQDLMDIVTILFAIAQNPCSIFRIPKMLTQSFSILFAEIDFK